MDTVNPPEPTSTPSVAPSAPVPSADPSPAEVQSRIDELMRSDAYQRSDRATTAQVQSLYQLLHGPASPDSPALQYQADVPVQLDVPPDLRDAVPTVVADDVAKTLSAVGLGSVSQQLFNFALGRGPAPPVPAGVRGREIAAGAQSWQEREGPYAQKQLDLAQDGLEALDHLAGHQGRLKQWVDAAGGVGNAPEMIALMARIGGRLQQMPGTRPLMEQLAQRRASDRR
jgi:hypothetical protein